MEDVYETRHYVPQSENEFEEIASLLIRNSDDFFPSLLTRHSFSRTMQVLKETGNIFYIKKLGEKRALAAITCIENIPEGPYVPFIIVDPEFRTKGWSKTLLGHLIEDLEKKSYAQINLETWSTNSAALNLFELYGFKVVNHIKDGRGKGIDNIKLSLSLRRK